MSDSYGIVTALLRGDVSVDRGKGIARQVFAAVGRHTDIVLDSNAAERPQPFNGIPVDMVFGRRAAKIIKQYVYRIQTWFYGQHHVFRQRPCQPQKRMPARRIENCA